MLFQRLKLILCELSLAQVKTREYADYFIKIEKTFESIDKLIALITENTCAAIDLIKLFRRNEIKKAKDINEIFENIEQKYSRFLKKNKEIEEKIKRIEFFNQNKIFYPF